METSVIVGRKKKVWMLVSLAVIVGFIVGVTASPLIIQSVAPISSISLHVGPAHLRLMNVSWVVASNSSTVEGLFLNVTNTDAISHRFFVAVQVMCLSTGAGPFFPPKLYTCANGANETMLLAPGASQNMPVDLNTALLPSRTMIDQVDLIITETGTGAISVISLPAPPIA